VVIVLPNKELSLSIFELICIILRLFFSSDLIDHGGAPCVPLITKLCEFILNKNQDAVIIAKELSEVSWQQLHTGHWKDVALAWRQLYSLACLLSVLIDRKTTII
jgi:hypothetical protein